MTGVYTFHLTFVRGQAMSGNKSNHKYPSLCICKYVVLWHACTFKGKSILLWNVITKMRGSKWQIAYRQISNISLILTGDNIVDSTMLWSLRCSWSIAYRRCSNYIFILGLTPGFIGLGKDNCTTRRKIFKFGDLVRLISYVLDILRYVDIWFFFWCECIDRYFLLKALWDSRISVDRFIWK